jgi:hypothetical protein
LLGILAFFSVPTVIAGGLFVSKHEGDMIHLLQILLRIADGDLPHLDFMTPLGLFGFAPPAFLVSKGMGAGMAMVWSQIFLGLILLPAVWWVAFSRMTGPVAYAFGGAVMLLCVALMQGTAETDGSLSRHYNRWCWAVSFIVIAAVMIPSQRHNHWIDGVIVGLCMTLLLMIKATYFIGFAPVVIIGLLMRKNTRALAIAIAAGLVLLGLTTIYTGTAFWLAYIRDLLAVATSEQRAGATLPLMDVIASPAYIPATAVLLVGVVFLRQSGAQTAGMLMLILAPGLWYVTYQNYENEPQWLILLALLLWALRPDHEVVNRSGWNMRNLVGATSICAAALIAPTVINLGYSPFRHMQAKAENFTPFLGADSQHDDFQLFNTRAFRMDKRSAIAANLDGGDAFTKLAKRKPAVVWQGEAFEYCTIDVGFVNWYKTIADQLTKDGFGTDKILMTDILSPLSIFGSFPALKNGAPWYYGNLAGLPDANYVLVPFCPITDEFRRAMLEQMITLEMPVTQVQRTDLYVLYRIER